MRLHRCVPDVCRARGLRVSIVAVFFCVAAAFGLTVFAVATADSATAETGSVWTGVFSSQPPVSPYYVGGSFAWTHHTGWVPNKSPGEAASVESWIFSGKVFGGYQFSDAFSLEAAYHHLGKVGYLEGFGAALYESHVRTFAFSASALYHFPQLPSWHWFGEGWPPAHVFVRGGIAYKNILQDNINGTFEEGHLSGVLGVGVQYKLSPRWFSRLEVEHLSVAIGGPVHSAPLLGGLINAYMGGTSQVPNVMNTQVMFTLGYQI